jgi:hypothetical protein
MWTPFAERALVLAAFPGLAFAFAALAVGVAALFVGGILVASRRLGDGPHEARTYAARALAGVIAWMALTGGLAGSGALGRFDVKPPPFVGLLVAMVVVAVAIGASPTGLRLARGLPIAALVGFHAFRLPLELTMDAAARNGLMPVQMSFSGWNFDIVTGATAVIVAILAGFGRAPRAVLVAWNMLGVALLLVIVGLALASTPMIHAFGSDPPHLNTFVGHFPFVWLPSVLVVAAASGHIVLARRLRSG